MMGVWTKHELHSFGREFELNFFGLESIHFRKDYCELTNEGNPRIFNRYANTIHFLQFTYCQATVAGSTSLLLQLALV